MSDTKTVQYTCGNCFHWNKVQPPIGTIPEIGRQRGICYGAPPTIEFMRNGSGQRNARPHTLETERACGMFVPAEAVETSPAEAANGPALKPS